MTFVLAMILVLWCIAFVWRIEIAFEHDQWQHACGCPKGDYINHTTDCPVIAYRRHLLSQFYWEKRRFYQEPKPRSLQVRK